MMRSVLLLVVLPVLLHAIPINELEGKFKSLQQELINLQQEMHMQQQQQQEKAAAIRPHEQESQLGGEYLLPELMAQRMHYGDLGMKPKDSQQKRLVYWQPMRKSVDNSKEQVIRAIESRLAEVIRAGEKLGVSADELLTHLKMRNSAPQ